LAVGGIRKPQKALTVQFVRTVRVPGKYFDGNGLFLRVRPNGSKQWVQHIIVRGKRSEIGLGSAELVPLANAREQALDNRRLARAGGDPLGERRRALSVPSFEKAARSVHSLHAPTWRNEKHARNFINSLQMYAFPRLGSRNVTDLTTADVLAVLSPIWLKKPETARRLRQRIGTVMKWAIAQGWRQDNPAESITEALPKHDRRKNHRKALPHSEVADCIRAVEASGVTLPLGLPSV